MTYRFHRRRNPNVVYVLKCWFYFLSSNSYIYLLLYRYSFFPVLKKILFIF